MILPVSEVGDAAAAADLYHSAAYTAKTGRSTDDSSMQEHVFNALDMNGSFGESEIVVPGRNPLLYELIDDEVTGHVINFSERVWPAGGLNISVVEP